MRVCNKIRHLLAAGPMNNISDFNITDKFSKVGMKSLALTALFCDLGFHQTGLLDSFFSWHCD